MAAREKASEEVAGGCLGIVLAVLFFFVLFGVCPCIAEDSVPLVATVRAMPMSVARTKIDMVPTIIHYMLRYIEYVATNRHLISSLVYHHHQAFPQASFSACLVSPAGQAWTDSISSKSPSKASCSNGSSK